MTKFNDYPKSVKKTLRYIQQDASLIQLNNLEKTLLNSIKNRREALRKEGKCNKSNLHSNVSY
ncbi:hypothetical protein POL89_30985 [Priestia megaterium]|nr:hypothetical protein [Priestia megaterium]MDC7783884.1 hypothetical protein [Priestia megaterium]